MRSWNLRWMPAPSATPTCWLLDENVLALRGTLANTGLSDCEPAMPFSQTYRSEYLLQSCVGVVRRYS